MDKEHNLFFGLSNVAIVGSRQSRKIRKDDAKPVFPQTAIVQVLYTGCVCQGCCRYKVGIVIVIIERFSIIPITTV